MNSQNCLKVLEYWLKAISYQDGIASDLHITRREALDYAISCVKEKEILTMSKADIVQMEQID